MSHHSSHSHQPEDNTMSSRHKWLAITGVVIMLLAMAVYVLTMDMVVAPNTQTHQPMPAAPAPSGP